MRLSELQHKDIVNLEGKKIGNIIDIKITEEGSILSMVIEPVKTGFKLFGKEQDQEISWAKIDRIGEDVILVKI